MSSLPEELAVRIFQAAINEGKAADLLECLFDGGSATVDMYTGKLLMVTAEQLGAM